MKLSGYTIRRKIIAAATLIAAASSYPSGLAAETPSRYEAEAGIEVRPDWVFPTNPFFKGVNRKKERIDFMGEGALSTQMKLGQGHKLYSSYPNLYQGIAIGLGTFSASGMVGSPKSIFLFQGNEVWRICDRLGMFYEWEFGASMGWTTNRTEPLNCVNGSSVTARLGLSLLLKYELSPRFTLTGGLDVTHFSNGNTRAPNAGTNVTGPRIALSYKFNRRTTLKPLAPKTPQEPDTLSKKRLAYDLLAWGAAHKRYFPDPDNKPQPLPGAFASMGLCFSPLYSLTPNLSVGGSLDLQWDEADNLGDYEVDNIPGTHPYYRRPPFFRQLALGLSARAEWMMPLFAVNVGIGRNLLTGGDGQQIFYQSLTLKTFITPKIWLNVGYSLRNFAHPRNLMIGVGYRFSGHGNPLPLSKLL